MDESSYSYWNGIFINVPTLDSLRTRYQALRQNGALPPAPNGGQLPVNGDRKPCGCQQGGFLQDFTALPVWIQVWAVFVTLMLIILLFKK